MFDQLVNDAASLFNVPAASVSALTRALLALMTNEQTGGPDGFLDLFRRVGLRDVITSWFSGHEGRPILPSYLESALGSSTLERLAEPGGLPRETATWIITFLLPTLIHQFTPNGAFLPSAAILAQAYRHPECFREAISPRALNKPEVGFSLEKTSSFDREQSVGRRNDHGAS
jgi:uncharacterized protein YidB (DUF937 family)